jgi:carbamoyl-phosphate synthase large subunit
MMILVLGAGGPAGVNFTKAAYECGHETVACDVDPFMLQLARGRHREMVRRERTATEINQLIHKYDVAFVHAQPDAEVTWLSANAHLLNAPTLLPNRAALFVCGDKYRTANAVGPDAPATLPLTNENELERAIEDLGGDCWMRLRTGAGSSGALPVSDVEIARAWMRHHRQFGIADDEWMLAERLPGRDLSWTGVFKDGELIAHGMKERLRLLGADRSPARIASTATLQVTIDRKDLHDLALRVTGALQGVPNGVFMLDAREDTAGIPKVTEVNCGRFGTTSMHWHHAGCSLVGAYVHAGLGREQQLGQKCEPGVAWVREMDAGAMKVKL